MTRDKRRHFSTARRASDHGRAAWVLLWMTRDAHPAVRMGAAYGLSRVLAEEGVAGALHRLERLDPDPEVRLAAAFVLSELPSELPSMSKKKTDVTIPREVLDRFRSDSGIPDATENHVREAIVGSMHDLVPCPACAGIGKMSAEQADYVMAALSARSPSKPPTAPELPASTSDDDEDEPHKG